MRNVRREFGLAIGLVALSGCGGNTPTPEADNSAAPETTSAAVAAADSRGALAADTRNAELQLRYSWQATIVVEKDPGFVSTTVYDRRTTLLCPLTLGDVSDISYFAGIDGLDPTKPVPGGAFQPWWNEGCSGELVVDDSYHFNDPTLAGEEPVMHTAGRQPLDTADAPITVELDLNKKQTRYFFPVASAGGFQREAGYGSEAALVPASAIPQLLDFAVPGALASGRQEFPLQGGVLTVEWTVSAKGP